MHDIFDAALEQTAKARGIKRLDAARITKPGEQRGRFTMAASTDRAFLKSVSMLCDLELLDERRDNVHHRNSGLDSTLAKLCASHGVLVGINLRNLRGLDPVVLGRVMQNIRLCRQHHARMAVFSEARTEDELPHEPDVLGLLGTLGMHPGEARAAVRALGESSRKARE